MPIDSSIIELHATASRQAIDLARRARPEQFTAPTPCAGWDLRRLLDHLTSENLGFAAAARGHGADRTIWAGDDQRADPVGDYVKATEDLMAAFAEPGVLDRSFALPLLSEQEFPGEQAVMMHLVDTVVHAWDLARTLDLPVEFDRPVTDPVLALSRQIPDDETRKGPKAFFGPVVPFAEDASDLDQIVALLGRSPSWPN